ncbi:MAG: aspartate aminotransferase family protein [Candidatus Promineifilaceae bacterium]
MNAEEVIAAEARYIVPTYRRPEIVFSHGRGAYLYDVQGREYLDFTAGIAVTALGHSDEIWARAVADQARQLTHVSNLYHTQPHVELARRLVENSFADQVFFSNSGAEANEAALKFARKFARAHDDGSGEFVKSGIVSFTAGFHGRSMGALSATYKEAYRGPFAPLVPGVTFAEYNDLASAAQAIGSDTCAVIVEPVQGEGGVRPASQAFLAGLRELCDANQALLVFDEVQCGLGRTGHLWAHEAYGVTPDIMTLAKPLAGGLPIGATLVTGAVGEVMRVGDHGSTFAGGPLVCRAAQVVFDRINQPEFLARVAQNGAYLMESLLALDAPELVDVRGAGLLLGLEFSTPVAGLIGAAREQGLLIISAGENVLRLCPPLIVTRQQIDAALAILTRCLDTLKE